MAIQDETITDVVLSMFKIIDNVAPATKNEKHSIESDKEFSFFDAVEGVSQL